MRNPGASSPQNTYSQAIAKLEESGRGQTKLGDKQRFRKSQDIEKDDALHLGQTTILDQVGNLRHFITNVIPFARKSPGANHEAKVIPFIFNKELAPARDSTTNLRKQIPSISITWRDAHTLVDIKPQGANNTNQLKSITERDTMVKKKVQER